MGVASRALRINKDQLVATQIDYNNATIEGSTRLYEYAEVNYENKTKFFMARGYEFNGVNEAPKFIVAAPVLDIHFDLAPDSPSKVRGVFVGLTKDYLDRLVPSGTAPDIGAFEQGAQPADPVP